MDLVCAPPKFLSRGRFRFLFRFPATRLHLTAKSANYKEYSMTCRYAIRPAGRGDLGRILQIEKASFGPEAYDRELFTYYLKRCGSLFLVASRRGRVCGYMITHMRGDSPHTSAELVSVAVDPAERQGGAASRLLESTLRRLHRRRATRMHLVVRVTNRPAQAFYEKYRFRRMRVLPGYYEDGGDGIAMSRPVASPRADRPE